MYSFNSSLSKNPIGDKGFEILLDALIAKPKGPIKKLGWVNFFESTMD